MTWSTPLLNPLNLHTEKPISPTSVGVFLMRCRYCNSKNTRVTCTDHFDKITKRYCRCLDCKSKFRTVEQYEIPKPGPMPGQPKQRNIVRGQSHGTSVFKETDIRMMRLLYEQGHTLKHIADQYGISSSYTSRIVNRKAWKHLV